MDAVIELLKRQARYGKLHDACELVSWSVRNNYYDSGPCLMGNGKVARVCVRELSEEKKRS